MDLQMNKWGRRLNAVVTFRVLTDERILVLEREMKSRQKKRWSGKVTRRSNALDLEPKVFKQRSPRRIALSLKRSAEASKRRRIGPYQSAMSMLNFYINRAGANLSEKQKGILVRAKGELRKAFHRE
jgi:hypothetical protein